MTHSDHITHISNTEDQRYLKTPLFDVNMRLFRTSDGYWRLVRRAAQHIEELCLTKMDGYKLPHGMSGANAGIPWNIIAISRLRGRPDAWAEVMLNPKIIWRSDDIVKSWSNCGSICLPESIEIRRYAQVRASWYDTYGAYHEDVFNGDTGGFTIQHEVDHNLGCLITDRAVGAQDKGAPVKSTDLCY